MVTNRFQDNGGMKRLTNDDLQCRDCKFRLDDSKIYGNTSRCSKYTRKPADVLSAERCKEYQPE